jgi:hypothetical protein
LRFLATEFPDLNTASLAILVNLTITTLVVAGSVRVFLFHSSLLPIPPVVSIISSSGLYLGFLLLCFLCCFFINKYIGEGTAAA